MHYEEKLIDGILHFRTDVNGTWYIKPKTITLSKTEYEAMKLQAAIGRLVLEKFVSGNDVPVSRCYINASEIEAISEDKHNG